MGRRKKGTERISRSEGMKEKQEMDGMEKTKRDEHFAHPSSIYATLPLPDGING